MTKTSKASVSKTRSSANKRALDSESAAVSEESMSSKRTAQWLALAMHHLAYLQERHVCQE